MYSVVYGGENEAEAVEPRLASRNGGRYAFGRIDRGFEIVPYLVVKFRTHSWFYGGEYEMEIAMTYNCPGGRASTK